LLPYFLLLLRDPRETLSGFLLLSPSREHLSVTQESLHRQVVERHLV
jgi:hypothetical protein